MELTPSLLAGFFAIIAAYFAWKLRMYEKDATLLVEKRKEKEELYKKIHRTFDAVIQVVKRYETAALQEDFIELNAEVALLATDELGVIYEETAQYLEEWAALFPRAWPNTNLIQAPDPAAKYKAPEREAYRKFLEQLQKLNKFMRTDLNGQP